MSTTKVTATSRFLSNIGLFFPFIICITVIAGTFNNIFSYAAFVMAAAGIVLMSEEHALCLMMFAMPFANIFKSSPEAQSFFTYLLFLYILFAFYRRRTVNASFLLLFLIFVTFLAFQMIFSINIFRSIKFVANLLFVYFAVNTKTENDGKNIFLFYVFGIAVSSAAVAMNLIPNLSNYFQVQDLGYDYDHMVRFSGLYADPNYYSINVIISLCIIILLNHKKQLPALPSLALAGLMVTFSIMTFSKSAFLMLIFPLVLFLYSQIKKKKYILSMILIFASIILVVYAFSGRISAFDIILSRLDQSDTSSLTTGRSDLWQGYIDHLMNSLLTLVFGAGFGAPIIGPKAAHNTYIDLAYYLGIIGTVLLLIVLHAISKSTCRKTRLSVFNLSIWICVMIMYFFLSELFYFDIAFHILLAVMATKTNFDPVQKES